MISTTFIKKIISSTISHRTIPSSLIPKILNSPELTSLVLNKEENVQSYNNSFFKVVCEHYIANNKNINKISLNFKFYNNNFSNDLHKLNSKPEETMSFFLKSFNSGDKEYFLNTFKKLFNNLPLYLQQDKEYYKNMTLMHPIVFNLFDISPLNEKETLDFISNRLSSFSFSDTAYICEQMKDSFPFIFKDKEIYNQLCKTFGKDFENVNIVHCPEEWFEDLNFLIDAINNNPSLYVDLPEDKKLKIHQDSKISNLKLPLEFLPYEIRSSLSYILDLLSKKREISTKELSYLPYHIQNSPEITSRFQMKLSQIIEINKYSIEDVMDIIASDKIQQSEFKDIKNFIDNYHTLPKKFKENLEFNLFLLDIPINSNIACFFSPEIKSHPLIIEKLLKSNKDDNETPLSLKGEGEIYLCLGEGNGIYLRNNELVNKIVENFIELKKTYSLLSIDNKYQSLLLNNEFNLHHHNFKKDNDIGYLSHLNYKEKKNVLETFNDYFMNKRLEADMREDLKQATSIKHKTIRKKF